MSLIDDPNDTAAEIIDAAGEITAAAADVAIEGAQTILESSSRRLRGSALVLILIVALAAVGYQRWRSSKATPPKSAEKTPTSSYSTPSSQRV